MLKPPYARDFRLGILGGGQLGRMLIAPSTDLDVKLCVLDPDPEAPCSRLVHEFTCGAFTDADTVERFGESCDVVTVEIEHVSVEGLRRLREKGVRVYPQPEVLETIQDKGLQKQFYERHNIPTAEFRLVDSKEQLREHIDFLPFVQKLRKGGYDGRGVQIIRSEADFEQAFDAPCVLERLVDIQKELAIIAARNSAGEVKVFPAVEMVFNPKANLVEYLFSPAQVAPDILALMEQMARDIATGFDLIGIMAVELFLTPDFQLLVNECAPRTHNSGHHTIEGNYTSQFAQHLRAVLGLPLGETRLRSKVAMVNLLGAEGHTGEVYYEGIDEALAMPGVYIHLYGKSITKPFRKMGHATVLADSHAELSNKVQKLKQCIQIKSNPR